MVLNLGVQTPHGGGEIISVRSKLVVEKENNKMTYCGKQHRMSSQREQLLKDTEGSSTLKNSKS